MFNSGIALTLNLDGHSIVNNNTDGECPIGIGTKDSTSKNDLTIIGSGAITATGDHAGIMFWGTGNTTTYSKLVIGSEDGTDTIVISGGAYGVSGNGTANKGEGTDITINKGVTVTATGEKSTGIYNPQDGKLAINGGTISGATGIEIRAGSLTVSGDDTKITGTANTAITSHANGNGSTSTGAGIAVAQHTTEKAITVNISGGEISGYTALAVANPEGNPAFGATSNRKQTVGTVAVNVTGGTLTSTSSDYKSSTSSEEVVDNTDREVTQYTYTGRNAIFNSDVRVNVSVAGAKINGNLASINDGTIYVGIEKTITNSAGKKVNVEKTRETSTREVSAYTVGGTTTFVDTFATSGDYSNLLSYTDSAVGYGLVVPQGWIRFNGWKGIVPGSTSGTGNAAISISSGDLSVSDLKYVADDKIFGLPESVTASWTESYANGGGSYYLAKYSYNNAKTEVAISSDTAGAIIRAGSSGILDKKVKKINASSASVALNIIGDANITAITGGSGNDSLVAGALGTTLSGGAGGDTLDGAGLGENTFVFSGGADSIRGRKDTDYISLDGIDATEDGTKISTEGDGFKITFGDSNTLTFADSIAAQVRSDNKVYTYSKDAIALNKSVTLASTATGYTLDSDNTYNAVNASAVSGAALIVGNSFTNTLIAGNGGNSLDGGNGNDNLRGGTGADVFVYGNKSGKDVIYGYGIGTDSLSVTETNIISGTTNNNGDLIFKIDNSNSITFKPTGDNENTDVTTVLLAGGSDSLTKDGVLGAADSILTVFSEQKGRVDLTDASIYGGIAKGIDASNVKKNAVTMVGGANGGTYTFAANNKKADVFEYGGGAVSLSSYETGTDKINLKEASWKSFVVDSTGVSLSTDKGVISIGGAQGKEILLHDATGKNNSFSKIIFYKTGVLHDKEKNPTEAILSAGAGGATSLYTAATSSIKKITIGSDVTAISVQGSSKNTTFDASAAGAGVSLIGGSGNDKFIGKKENADTFAFNANMGKDVITNYEATDKIVLDGAYSLGAAKITQSRKSVTLKFDNKNSLAIKADSSIGAVNINGTDYSFGKNAVITTAVEGSDSITTAELTKEFSGTYKASSGVDIIDGSAIEKKNYTMQGTSAKETLTAGRSESANNSRKKVTFKGNGGGDSYIGGTSKDSFFYARNDTGATTVDYFDYANDNLKIKRTLTGINKTSDGLVFEMGTGNSLTLKTDNKNNNVGSSNILIKANNTLYWFETGSEGYGLYTAKDKDSKDAIKDVLRSKSDYSIVDLNYSTNLVKAKVAGVTETTFTAAMAENYKIK